jgi:hypothetical protein
VAECLFALLQHFNPESSQRFTATLWSLWKHRNLKLWEDINETEAQVIDRAFHLIEDWNSANSKTHSQTQSSTHIPGRFRAHHDTAPSSSSDTAWKRPCQGRLKCNIYASFSDSLNRTGVGMCIRDAEGLFVLAKTLNFSPKCSVPLGEALGLFSALQWLRDLGLDHVDFALD